MRNGQLIGIVGQRSRGAGSEAELLQRQLVVSSMWRIVMNFTEDDCPQNRPAKVGPFLFAFLFVDANELSLPFSSPSRNTFGFSIVFVSYPKRTVRSTETKALNPGHCR